MLTLGEMGFVFAFAIFLVGFFGLMMRKNILLMMLSVELMLNAANLAFLSASHITGTIDGQVALFFVIAVAACEAGIGLALVISLYRLRGTIEVDDLKVLRG